MISMAEVKRYGLLLLVLFAIFRCIPTNTIPMQESLILTLMVAVVLVRMNAYNRSRTERFQTATPKATKETKAPAAKDASIPKATKATRSPPTPSAQRAGRRRASKSRASRRRARRSRRASRRSRRTSRRVVSPRARRVVSPRAAPKAAIVKATTKAASPAPPIKAVPSSPAPSAPRQAQSSRSRGSGINAPSFQLNGKYAAKDIVEIVKAFKDDNVKYLDLIKTHSLKDDMLESIIQVIQTDVKTATFIAENNPERLMFIIERYHRRRQDKLHADADQRLERKLKDARKMVDNRGFISDMGYAQLSLAQMQPLGSYDSTFTNDWRNDYTLLNTDKWRPPAAPIPRCKAEKECPVCPVATSGYPVRVQDFNDSRRILPPDEINIDFIRDKLNQAAF